MGMGILTCAAHHRPLLCTLFPNVCSEHTPALPSVLRIVSGDLYKQHKPRKLDVESTVWYCVSEQFGAVIHSPDFVCPSRRR